ncbi:MAG: hypothetical protein P8R43_05410 [Planctomycetota bacterium]|nr:hypothetical protein [Planctomycetota bacterium]
MTIRTIGALTALLLLAPGCRSAGTAAQEPLVAPVDGAAPATEPSGGAEGWTEPEAFVPPPPPEWTGAFGETAVLLANTLRIEGPAPLLLHVVASSDKELYERSVTTTARGFVQVIKRRATSSREVRVQLDAWSLAAMEEVVIVETAAQGPVKVFASGNVIWRDLDARLMQGEQLQFTGAIGDESPYAPPPGSGTR